MMMRILMIWLIIKKIAVTKSDCVGYSLVHVNRESNHVIVFYCDIYIQF